MSKPTRFKDAVGKTICIGSKVKYLNKTYEVEVDPVHLVLMIGEHELAPNAQYCRVMPDITDSEIYTEIYKLQGEFYGQFYGKPTQVFLGTDLIEVLVDARKKWELTHYVPTDTWVSHGLFGPTVMMIMDMEVVPVATEGHISVGVSVRSSK